MPQSARLIGRLRSAHLLLPASISPDSFRPVGTRTTVTPTGIQHNQQIALTAV